MNKTLWKSYSDLGATAEGWRIAALSILAGVGIATALDPDNYESQLGGCFLGMIATFPATFIVADYKRQEPPKELLLNEWKVIN